MSPRPRSPPRSPSQPQANSCSGEVAASRPRSSPPLRPCRGRLQPPRALGGPRRGSRTARASRARGAPQPKTREPSDLGQMCPKPREVGLGKGSPVGGGDLKNTCYSAPNLRPLVLRTSRTRGELRLGCEHQVPGQQLVTFEGVVGRSCPALSSSVKEWGHPGPPARHSCRILPCRASEAACDNDQKRSGSADF